jgi:hypothetical protein
MPLTLTGKLFLRPVANASPVWQQIEALIYLVLPQWVVIARTRRASYFVAILSRQPADIKGKGQPFAIIKRLCPVPHGRGEKDKATGLWFDLRIVGKVKAQFRRRRAKAEPTGGGLAHVLAGWQ